MDAAHFYLEKMMPDLLELEEKGALTAEQVKDIIVHRRKHEYRIHRRIKLETDFLDYVAYEKQVQEMVMKNIKDKDYTKSKVDFSVRSRIEQLYDKLCQRFPSVDNYMGYTEWLIQCNMKNRASQLLIQFIQTFPNDPLPYLKSAEVEMFTRHNYTGAKAVLTRAMRHLSSLEVFVAYAKLEVAFLTKVYERQRLMETPEDLSQYLAVFETLFDHAKETLAGDKLVSFHGTLAQMLHEMHFLDTDKVLQHLKLDMSPLEAITSQYTGTLESFEKCVGALELLSETQEGFLHLQDFLVKAKAHSYGYIKALMASGAVLEKQVYLVAAVQGHKEALVALGVTRCDDVWQYGYESAVGMLGHFELEEKDIEKLCEQFGAHHYAKAASVYDTLAMYMDVHGNAIILHPRIRRTDLEEIVQRLFEVNETMAPKLLKQLEASRNKAMWQHYVTLVKGQRQVYTRAVRLLVKCG